jgi:hypothetical protein
MPDKIWNELVRAADDDYELCLYDRENMLQDIIVSFLVGRGFYRFAVEVWLGDPIEGLPELIAKYQLSPVLDNKVN